MSMLFVKALNGLFTGGFPLFDKAPV